MGYALGGFTELNSINFDIMKEEMFAEKVHTPDMDEHEDDVYEDEEVELSDTEEEEALDTHKPNFFSRVVQWFMRLIHRAHH